GPTPRAPCDDRALDLGGPAEQRPGPLDLPGAKQVADARRRDPLDQRHGADVETEPVQELEVTGPSAAEAEVRPSDDDLGAYREQHALDELLRPELRDLEVEVDHQRLDDSRLPEELEAPFERRQQLDAVAEGDAGVRVERDHGRRLPGRDRSVEDPAMTAMDPVERPERDRPGPGAALARVGSALPAAGAPAPAASSRASASSAGISRSGSASSTRNGPTSVRRNVTQWPPSAVAIERT